MKVNFAIRNGEKDLTDINLRIHSNKCLCSTICNIDD